MNKPLIHLHDPRWKKSLRPYCKTVEGIVSAISPPAGGRLRGGHSRYNSKSLGKNAPTPALPLRGREVSIVLADDAFVQNLNKHYRGTDKPTNVLSFPNAEEPLGDVILAYETIAREAEEQGKSFKHHTTHLIVHGILHLMGYDHEEEAQANKMEAKETEILKKLGIPNPYL